MEDMNELPEAIRGKKQVLSEADRHVLALLKLDIPVIVGWDGERGTFIVAGITRRADVEPDCVLFDQDEWLVYEVSNGLPGDRTFSEDHLTLDDAMVAHDSA